MMIRSSVLFSLGVILFFSPMEVFAQAEKFDFRTYKARSGLKLLYRIHVPANLQKGTPIPMVLALHGSGERDTNNTDQLTANRLATLWAHDTVQSRFPSIVVAPQCPPTDTWVSYYQPVDKVPIRPPLQAVVELVDSLEREFTLDKGRLYLVGLSMGAFASWDLLARHPGRFAAAIPICGAGDTTKAALMKKTPIWAFHGSMDEVVDVKNTRSMIAALKAVGTDPEPKYTEYIGVRHESWKPALIEPDLPKWLFAQRLPGTASLRAPLSSAPEAGNRRRVRLLTSGEACGAGAVRADGRAADPSRSAGR